MTIHIAINVIRLTKNKEDTLAMVNLTIKLLDLSVI